MEIRWYYTVLRHSWKIILVSTLIPGIVALIVSINLPPTYESQADIVLFKSKADITFDPRFQTISEDDLIRLSGQDPRRQTFATLAQSGEVYQKATTKMPSKWQTGWSLKRLSEDTEVSSVGNLLQLTVKANNPEEATDVANAWAQVFVDIANAAFQQPATAIEVIEDQVNSSRLEYDSAQKALEDFLQSSMIEELQLEIDIRESAIEDIRFSFQNSTKEQLTALLNARDQTNQSINAARALQERIAYLGDGETVDAATQYALLLLELNTFKTFDRFANLEEGTFTSGTNQYTLQINIPEINTATMTASEARLASDQLIAASQSLLEGLEELITEASTDTLFAPDLVAQTSTISQLQIELDQIKADLESEESRLKELIEARDLALDNYNTLSRKASEINIETQTSQTEVVIAAKAVVPDVRSGPNHIINIGAGTALGLIASLFVAFIRAHLDESLAQEQIKRTSI